MKFFLVILSIVLSLLFIGCEEKNSSLPKNSPQEARQKPIDEVDCDEVKTANLIHSHLLLRKNDLSQFEVFEDRIVISAAWLIEVITESYQFEDFQNHAERFPQIYYVFFDSEGYLRPHIDHKNYDTCRQK